MRVSKLKPSEALAWQLLAFVGSIAFGYWFNVYAGIWMYCVFWMWAANGSM